MRRGTAATSFGAAMAVAAALLGVTAGARLATAGREELPRTARAIAAAAARDEVASVAVAPSFAAQRVEELPRGVDEPEGPTVERRIRVVRAADQAPLAGAAITLRDLPEGWRDAPPPRRPVERRADANGELRLAVDRTVDAIVRVAGYCVEAEEVEFDATAPLAERTIALHPAATLSGRVVDAGGAPVEGARVRALGSFLRESEWVGRAGCGNGWHAWNGDLGTTGADSRFGPIACYAGGTPAFEVTSWGRTLVLPGLALDAARGPSFDVELRLPPRVELVVRAERPDGQPAHGDALRAVVTRRFELFAAIDLMQWIDDEGRCAFELAAPGPHRVVVRSSDFDDPLEPGDRATAELDLRAGTTEVVLVVPWPAGREEDEDEDEEESCLPEGEEAEEQAPATITGTIGCDCGAEEACDSLHVVVRRDGVEVDAVESPYEEAYEFDDLVPGRYVVSLEGAGHRAVESGPVAVKSGDLRELPRLVAPALGRVRGRFVDPSGRPLNRIEATLVGTRDPERERCAALTDETGRFEMARVDGPCVLDVIDCEVGSFRFAVPDPLPADWTVTLPAPRRITGVVAPPFGVASRLIELYWEEAFEPARFRELLRPVGGAPAGKTEIGSDGRFVIERAPSGDCVLEIRFDDHPRIGWMVARRVLPAGGDVDLGTWELPAAR